MSHAKGNTKHKERCKAYRNNFTRETNKKRKITRHVKRHPNDHQNSLALKNL